MRPGIEAVAFDLDGTLYPNYSLNVRLIPLALKNPRLFWAFGKVRKIMHSERATEYEAGVEYAAEAGAGHAAASAEHEAGAGHTNFYNEQAALAAGIMGAQPDIIRNRIEKLIYRGWEPYFRKIKLYPGVLECLEAFRGAGLKLGLLSDFPPQTKLKHLGIDSWDAVLCSERTGRLKPKAAPFAELAKALGIEPGKILYVGNSFRYDVTGAKKAGMSAALIKRSLFSTGAGIINKKEGFQADFVFFDYRQLRDYVLS
jgi:putative hydrolase of the HAD superfamily